MRCLDAIWIINKPRQNSIIMIKFCSILKKSLNSEKNSKWSVISLIKQSKLKVWIEIISEAVVKILKVALKEGIEKSKYW